MFLVDLTHTSHSRARTGVQRVARALVRAEGSVPICHDPYANAWRPLRRWEEANLESDGAGSTSRGSRWPLRSKLAGFLGGRKRPPSIALQSSQTHALLVPEIFSPEVARALPALLAFVPGPRAAIFHDAIALKLPEHAPAKTLARFPAYLEELRQFDGIAANSEDSRDTLVRYWKWLGVRDHPPVVAIPLGIDLPPAAQLPIGDCRLPNSAQSPFGNRQPAILSVGTIEGRKNHIALLEACEGLWRDGLKFELRLVGLARAETAGAALERIKALQAAGRALRCEGAVSDAELEAAYASCTFTVYPSLMEGFGLPVLESVSRGKPCICSARGALGESARGGGCIALAEVDAGSLRAAIRPLLENPEEVSRLAALARQRTFRGWDEYADDVSRWLSGLKRR